LLLPSHSQELINYFIRFQAVYQDKLNRINQKLNDIEAEMPRLMEKKEELEVG
jgi:hypothetical protein